MESRAWLVEVGDAVGVSAGLCDGVDDVCVDSGSSVVVIITGTRSLEAALVGDHRTAQ
jgi:hypothetical protein